MTYLGFHDPDENPLFCGDGERARGHCFLVESIVAAIPAVQWCAANISPGRWLDSELMSTDYIILIFDDAAAVQFRMRWC